MSSPPSTRIAWLIPTLDPRIASVRYRCLMPARGLAALGYESEFFTSADELTRRAGDFDCVIIVKSISARQYPLAAALARRKIPLLIDLCDHIFVDAYAEGRGLENVMILAGMARHVSAIVTTNPSLSEAIRDATGLTDLRFVEIVDHAETRQELVAVIPESRSLTQGFSIRSALKRIKKSILRPKDALSRLGVEILGFPTYALVRQMAPRDPIRATQIVFDHFFKRPACTKPNHEKTVIWFGNHGSPHSDFGMESLLTVAPVLASLSKEIDLELLVVSNNGQKYRSLIAPLPFPTRYQEWSLEGIYDELANAHVCVLPNGSDLFSRVKSANRAVLALSTGVPVVATHWPALEPLRGAIVLNDWQTGLRRYLLDDAARQKDLSRAREIIGEQYSSEVVATQWRDLLDSVCRPRSKAVPRLRDQTLVLYQLIQDIEVLRPVASALLDAGEKVTALIGPNAAAAAALALEPLRGRGLQTISVEDAAPKEALVRAARLVTASETNVRAHRLAHAITKQAKAIGVPTYTLQHGLENIGLTYEDARYGPDVAFEADTIFTWRPAEDLPDFVQNATRQKCVGVGRSIIPPTKRVLPISSEGARILAVFENLHWDRYSQAYRDAFLADLYACTEGFRVVIKPHPAGRWLTERSEAHLAAAKRGLIIADPLDPNWAGISAVDLIEAAAAIVTTPSTTALDAALAAKPVAVASYGLTLPAYAPLTLLSQGSDWTEFLDRVRAGDAALSALSADFAARCVLPGDATPRIVAHLLQSGASYPQQSAADIKAQATA